MGAIAATSPGSRKGGSIGGRKEKSRYAAPRARRSTVQTGLPCQRSARARVRAARTIQSSMMAAVSAVRETARVPNPAIMRAPRTTGAAARRRVAPGPPLCRDVKARHRSGGKKASFESSQAEAFLGSRAPKRPEARLSWSRSITAPSPSVRGKRRAKREKGSFTVITSRPVYAGRGRGRTGALRGRDRSGGVYISSKNLSWIAFTARLTSSSSRRTETRISEVLIIWMLMPAS